MKIQFQKMTGAGNDFVVVDNRSGAIGDGAAMARKMCDRHWGVGADGLLMLENSRKAAYRMMYYNADGSYGGMCGNGGRCIAAYAVNHGIAVPRHEFEALDHVYQAIVDEESVQLAMKDPVGLKTGLVLLVLGKRLEMTFVDTGAPHVVVLAEKLGRKGLDGIDVLTIGRTIRMHRRFRPSGTNVNFVEVQRDKSLRIRTYERGVEDETLACGTGSIASAIVASKLRGLSPPITVVPMSMKKLVVGFRTDKGGKISGVSLSGPAERVFNGEIDIP
jgi:diaminopimelate epimerase